MAAFTFTSPSGQQYTVNGPPGATQQQAFAILQQHIAQQASAPKQQPQPLVPGDKGQFLRTVLSPAVGALEGIGDPVVKGVNWAADKADAALGINKSPDVETPSQILEPALNRLTPQPTGAQAAYDEAGRAIGALASPLKGVEQVGSAAMRAGRQIPAFDRLLTAGQRSGSAFLQSLEASLGRLWGSGAIKNAIAKQNTFMGNKVSDVVENLFSGAGRDGTPSSSGSAIYKALGTALDSVKSTGKQIYDNLTASIPGDLPVPLPNTKAALDKFAAPVPGAPAISATTTAPPLARDRAALISDLKASSEPTEVPPQTSTILGADGKPAVVTPGKTIPPTNPETLPMSTVRDWKTRLDAQIDHSPFGTDAANGQRKVVAAALKQDIENAAAASDPALARRLAATNAVYGSMQDWGNHLSSLITEKTGEQPEQLYDKLFQMTGQAGSKSAGLTQLGRVWGVMAPEDRVEFSASILQRMGLENPGMGGAFERKFSANTFLTNWNKMNPSARHILFGSLPEGYENSINEIASNIEKIKKFGQLVPNSSNTAEANIKAEGIIHLLGGLTGAGIGYVKGGDKGSAVGAGLGVAGTLAIGTGAVWALSKILTTPRAARWLAVQTGKIAARLAMANAALSHAGKAPQSSLLVPAAAGAQH